EELVRSSQSYLSTSLLPKGEKERLLDELAETAPHVAHALLEHFNAEGKVQTEHWVETIYRAHYETEPVAIRLHGKLDAIITNAQGTAVYDYKTRKSMSIAAIKGETKGSTGNYFRQLVF